jgi:hypothetical protein
MDALAFHQTYATADKDDPVAAQDAEIAEEAQREENLMHFSGHISPQAAMILILKTRQLLFASLCASLRSLRPLR